MRKFLGMIAIATLAALCATQVSADRLILMPMGSVLGRGSVKAEAAFGSGIDTGSLSPANSDRIYWANIGLGSLELTGMRLERSGGFESNALGVELCVLPETIITPALGVGVLDLGDDIGPGRGYYLAASKTVPLTDVAPLPIHDVKVLIGYGFDGINGFFGGAQIGLPMSLTLSLEHDGENFNAALSWDMIPKVGLKVYSLDGEIFVGASLKVGL